MLTTLALLQLSAIDITVFAVFVASVIAVGLYKSRGEKDTSEDYFLAGRGLTWPLIGFSLIAANISAEQMVGMAGQSANGEIGLAIASYEWMAAITLVVVGFFFLPKFLRSGIYTIPQFLEYRYDTLARTVMSVLVVVTLVVVNVSTVTYLGAEFLLPFFAGVDWMSITFLCWVIGLVAAIYVAAGGLKACAWADLIQGAALIIGGGIITWLAILALKDPDPTKYAGINPDVNGQLGVGPDATVTDKLGVLKEQKMSMFLPKSNSILPWTALVVGLWIPNFYYWGLNQYIMQRTLGAKSLAQGQKGIVFAAFMKLIIPFVVCVPGIIAFTLYSGEMGQRVDEDMSKNQPILAQWADLQAGGVSEYNYFQFDDDFAERRPDMARSMFDHNAALAGVDTAQALDDAQGTDPADGQPRTPPEVLAEANSRAIDTVPKDQRAGNVSGMLVGYAYDKAFPMLVSLLAPSNGFRGFIVAAVMGAVVSSLASMLNAASTVFTVDVYGRFLDRAAPERRRVWVGRIGVIVAVVIGCLIAPAIDNPVFQGAFTFIQEFQGFISPGILTIFLFGLFVHRAPRMCGWLGLVLSPIIYGALKLWVSLVDFAPGSLGETIVDPFLNRMAITIGVIALVLGILTALRPLPKPIDLPEEGKMELQSSGIAKFLGVLCCIITVVLYIIFR